MYLRWSDNPEGSPHTAGPAVVRRDGRPQFGPVPPHERSPLSPVLCGPPIAESLFRRTREVPGIGPLLDKWYWHLTDHVAFATENAAEPATTQGICPALGLAHHPGSGSHGRCLGAGHPMFIGVRLGVLGPQVHQDLRDVDLDWTHVVARA